MNDDYKEWYKKYRKTVEEFWETVQIADEDKVNYLVSAIREAISEEDEDKVELLVDATYEIKNELIQVAALNELLLIKEHRKHQEITKTIQDFAHPSSVRYINTIIEGGFDHLEYNGSDSDVIAKWFSHALSCIGTKEAIDTIKNYADSPDDGIKREMRYRLAKIKT